MPGRNDQCPCGSGKKYKKCCLEKDRNETDQRIRAEQLELATANSTPPSSSFQEPIQPPTSEPAEEPDPHTEALNARWTEFEAEDDEGCRRVFLKTLDEPELMDDEMAFGMLERFYLSASETGKRDQFAELVELLRERLPEIYRESRKYYLLWRIEMAVAGYQVDRLPEFAREIAETAGEDVDNYQRAVSLLAYHGELAALSEACRIAWPLIETSDNILWGQRDFAVWGADCAIFERLESSPEIDVVDPQLIEQVRFYFTELDLHYFQKYVARLSGSSPRSWSLDDFEFKIKNRSKRKERKEINNDEPEANNSGSEALNELLGEFVSYAHRQEGISYTKASLALKNIYQYLMERHEGKLEPQQSMLDAMMNPRRKPTPRPRRPDHPLCPDHDTFDRYLASMLDLMSMRVHDVAATFELMPTWLRFLQIRGLIDSSRRESTLADISDLQPTLLKLWSSERLHTTIAENIRAWPENAQRPCAVSPS